MQSPALRLSNLILLALTYFFYFGQMGVLTPYLSVFLDGRGYTSQDIGEIFALMTIVRILGPNLWAHFADKSGRPLFWLQLGSCLCFATFCFAFWSESYWTLTLSFAFMMLFWSAILPQMEVITLNCIQGDAQRYSRLRLWGSLGFVALAVITGMGIDAYSTEAFLPVLAITLLVLFLITLFVKELKGEKVTQDNKRSILPLLKTRTFVFFILSATFLQMSFGPYYSFFGLYLKDLGFNGEQTGWITSVAVLAEVVIFLFAGKLIHKFGVKGILVASILFTTFRWYLLAAHPNMLALLIVSQTLHAFSFALTHAASMHFIHRYFGVQFQSRGQALYGSIAFGLGGAGGNYIAGLLWQQGAGSMQSYVFAMAMSALSALFLLFVSSACLNVKAEKAS